MFYTICEKGAYFRIQRLIFYLSVFKIEISNRDAKTIHLNLNFQKSGVRNMGYKGLTGNIVPISKSKVISLFR